MTAGDGALSRAGEFEEEAAEPDVMRTGDPPPIIEAEAAIYSASNTEMVSQSKFCWARSSS